MRILNILHSRYYAGSETAFVNLTKILSGKNTVFCIIPERSYTKNDLQELAGINIIEYNKAHKNLGKFDLAAKRKIAKLIKINNIDLIIVHNGRMLELLGSSRTPVIAFNHGTNPAKTAKADYAFVINTKMRDEVEKAGMSKENIFLIPNCINI